MFDRSSVQLSRNGALPPFRERISFKVSVARRSFWRPAD